MTSQPLPHPAYREHPPPGKSRKINSLSRYDVAGQLNSSRALTWPAGAMGRRHGPGQQCRSYTEWQACDGLAQALHKNWGILSDAPVNQSVQRSLQIGTAPTRKLVRHFPISTWASSDTRWNSITMSWAFCCLAIMKIRSRPCKIHRNIQPSDPQRVLRACVAIASAAAQIHSRASRGAKSPLRPKRTIARSSQRML